MTETMFQLIKCGKLYDGKSDCLKENMQILIKEKHILEVGADIGCVHVHRSFLESL